MLGQGFTTAGGRQPGHTQAAQGQGAAVAAVAAANRTLAQSNARKGPVQGLDTGAVGLQKRSDRAKHGLQHAQEMLGAAEPMSRS
jgi:hypothetical protein